MYPNTQKYNGWLHFLFFRHSKSPPDSEVWPTSDFFFRIFFFLIIVFLIIILFLFTRTHHTHIHYYTHTLYTHIHTLYTKIDVKLYFFILYLLTNKWFIILFIFLTFIFVQVIVKSHVMMNIYQYSIILRSLSHNNHLS